MGGVEAGETFKLCSNGLIGDSSGQGRTGHQAATLLTEDGVGTGSKESLGQGPKENTGLFQSHINLLFSGVEAEQTLATAFSWDQ